MKIVLITGFLFLCSCLAAPKNEMSIPELDLKLSEEWMYALKIEKLKSNEIELTRPPGFEQLVMEFVIPQKGGLSLKTHCVYYQVPYKEKISSFKVMEINAVDSCPETSEIGKQYISISGLNKMKVTFKNFKLTLDFYKGSNKHKIEIVMPNIEAGVVHEKYRSIKEKKLMSGLKFLRLDEDSFDFASNKYLGKLSDRFSRGSAIRCQQVNKDCETVGENRCEECRYGWFEVVDFQCAGGGSKFCGQNHCGEKNEPACPRGVKVIDPGEAGICQSDLEPVLNAEKILVCQ